MYWFKFYLFFSSEKFSKRRNSFRISCSRNAKHFSKSEISKSFCCPATKKFKYPLTPAFIAKQLGVTKREVNSFISKHRDDFLRYECQPPLWKVRPTATDPTADDSVVLELQKLTLEPAADLVATDPK